MPSKPVLLTVKVAMYESSVPNAVKKLPAVTETIELALQAVGTEGQPAPTVRSVAVSR
jgi:hypothetical protein